MQPLERCLSCCLGYSGDQGDERWRSEIRSRNEPFLLIGQDRKTNDAIVLMGKWAEFARMCNGAKLPGQEQG